MVASILVKSKNNVKHMVETMIGVYQDRLTSNTWLSEHAKQKAIVKLNKLGIHVGYPDKIPAIYDRLHTDPDASLLQNALRFWTYLQEDLFSKMAKAGRSRGVGNVCSNSQCLLSSFQECDRLPSSYFTSTHFTVCLNQQVPIMVGSVQ